MPFLRIASAKVQLFLKPAKHSDTFFVLFAKFFILEDVPLCIRVASPVCFGP